ncbi:carotenoid oxygenase family protein [Streptomyces sp. TS71-3]|uniref:carotenoid oxygenase family protein n=1 Tax=Streptomyces sp. TS71-3 TaxID=2733862 RepID=UPI001B181B9E|nr:carotenoid oxygenase family protein [Streptomyces sp. TS71-3]GHJ37152.1 carotenoid cleavage dioxygenase [Streptomyces sp. TS71-3]
MMTTPPPPHLARNYAPVMDEMTVQDLDVTGSIPPELSGWYVRNGPNPQDARSAHWFFGDGMVHGVRLDSGRATSYRNRWVRTTKFTDGRTSYGENGEEDLTAGSANTHVVRHAGRTFALVESSLPYELDCRPGREFDTVGPYDFGGRLDTAMTAHPKTCPVTGELHFFGYGGFKPPFLTYHRADASGALTVSRPIDVPAHTMMHDFHLTTNYVVFMDLPVVFDRETAMRGDDLPYKWHPGYGARLGVLRRNDPYGAVHWLPVEPCYVFHAMNAFDEGPGSGRIVMYVSRYPVYRETSATMWRWEIDVDAGKVVEVQLDDTPCEFPRVDDRLAGQDSRFGHVTVTDTPNLGTGLDRSYLVRYDLHTGDTTRHEFGAGRVPNEAAFAASDGTPGGPGWLLSYVYDASTDKSDLVILDAQNVVAPPVATIHLPRRVPFGFHGNWLPDE